MLTQPRDSSAVLATRERDGEAEVLLVLRSRKLRFFGGYWAFPGGAVDAADGPAGTDRALARCAQRELFEETGLFPRAWGERPRNADAIRNALLEEPPRQAAWAEVRPEIEPRSFGRITTPAFAPVRFATRFFHVRLAASDEPEVWPGELEDARFFSLAALFAAWRRGELPVVPPVLFLLARLHEHGLERGLEAAALGCTAIEAGRLHEVYPVPGIFQAPLETPTLPPATTTNTYVVGTEKLWIVDPATTHASERARLFELTDAWRGRIAGVLLTHHHADHVGSAAQVSERYGVDVYAHPLTLERLELERARPLFDGQELELGPTPDGAPDWRLTAWHTPGHAPGHLAFVENRYRAAIVGDLLSTVSTIVIDPRDGHLATYLGSLRRLLALEIRSLLPAHGVYRRDGAALVRAYLAHRVMREQALIRALATQPSRIEDLLPVVYAGSDPALFSLARLSLLSGLEKLVEEGVARALEGGGWELTGTRGESPVSSDRPGSDRQAAGVPPSGPLP